MAYVGKEPKKNVYVCVSVCVCVYVTDSLPCIPETNISLKINYTSIKILKK